MKSFLNVVFLCCVASGIFGCAAGAPKGQAAEVVVETDAQEISTTETTLPIEPSEQWRYATLFLEYKSQQVLPEDVEFKAVLLASVSMNGAQKSSNVNLKGSESLISLVIIVPPKVESISLKLFALDEHASVLCQQIDFDPTPNPFEAVTLYSPMMSEFLGEPWYHEAHVCIPRGSASAVPVIHHISGFMEDREQSHEHNLSKVSRKIQSRPASGEAAVAHVFPNVGCRYGHHTFHDSKVNGPIGTAYVTEFLPHLDQLISEHNGPEHRFVTGHSSGGWTVVQLMLNFPDAFAYGLATAPDPLSFTQFHDMNIYQDQNAFTRPDGTERIFGRDYPKGDIVSWKTTAADPTIDFYPKQIVSYEAAFGFPMPDGSPAHLFDRSSGEINSSVAQAWKSSDLSILADQYEGTPKAEVFDRLRIVCGTEDNFGLHEGVRVFGSRGNGKSVSGEPFLQWIDGGDHFFDVYKFVNDFEAFASSLFPS